MSVRLVFVWSDGPDCLEGELLRRRPARRLHPGVLRTQFPPFTLPERERRRDLPRDRGRERVFDVVVACAGDPALAQLVRRPGVPADVSRPGPGILFPHRVELGPQRPFAVQRLSRWTPGQSEIETADLGAQTGVRVGTVQAGGTDLHVGGACELPEVEQVHEVRGASAPAEQLGVACAACDLRGDLVRAEAAERSVQGDSSAGEAVVPEIRPQRGRVFRLRERVQVPAVQLAELLAELSDVEADVAGESGPIGVPLLYAHLSVLQADEDLGARVRIERRLKADLEFPGIEVVPLDSWTLRGGPDVARDADLGVQLCLVPLPSDEPRLAAGVRPFPQRVRPRCGRGGGAQRRQLVTGTRILRGARRRRAGLVRQRGAQAVEPRPQRPELRGERVDLPLERLLRAGVPRAHRDETRERDAACMAMDGHLPRFPPSIGRTWRPAAYAADAPIVSPASTRDAGSATKGRGERGV